MNILSANVRLQFLLLSSYFDYKQLFHDVFFYILIKVKNTFALCCIVGR